MFQSTPPHGGRPEGPTKRFQSTPPHGGRLQLSRHVSIHAPARGATVVMFQSTPPHGGRPAGTWSNAGVGGFNPRPRTGGDATIPGRFNPRPRTGGTPVLRRRCFNPRPRTGGDDRAPANREVSFNPRPRTGGDLPPARGARRMFQSTPPHGGRLRCVQLTPRAEQVFQSTPPHGGRAGCDTSCRFNPRPRTGGDRGHLIRFGTIQKSVVSANLSRRGVVSSGHWENRRHSGQRNRSDTMCEPCRGILLASDSRTFIARVVRRGRTRLSFLHARFGTANWRRADRSADCPLVRRSH